MIAPTRPRELIRSSKQGIDFETSQELDQGAGEAFAGDGEHALDLRRIGRPSTSLGGFRCLYRLEEKSNSESGP